MDKMASHTKTFNFHISSWLANVFMVICIFVDSDFKTEYSAQADACSKLLIETQDKSADCSPACVQI